MKVVFWACTLFLVHSVLASPPCNVLRAVGENNKASKMTVVTTSYWPALYRGEAKAEATVVRVLEPGNSGLKKGSEIVVYFPRARMAKMYSIGGEDQTFENVALKPFHDDKLRFSSDFDKKPIYVVEGKVSESKESVALTQELKNRDVAIKSVASRSEFDKFKDLWKRNILAEDSNEYLKNKNLVFTQVKDPKEIRDPKLRKFAEFMKEQVSGIEIQSDREGYVTVGNPEASFVVIQTKAGEILGGNATVSVKGGEYKGRKTHFPSVEAAKKGRVEDISTKWQVRGVFTHDKKVLVDPYLDWVDG